MAEDPRLHEFVLRLRAGVADAALEETVGADDVPAIAFREEAFVAVLLGLLEDHGQVPDTETCFLDRRLGRGFGKVNAWQVDEDGGVATLVTAIFRGLPEPTSITQTDLTVAVERASRVFSEARSGYHMRMEPASCAFDMLERLHASASVIDHLRIVVLGDGFATDFTPSLDGPPDVEVTVDVWDIRRLFRLDASGLPYEPIEIDIRQRAGGALPAVRASSNGSEFDVYLTAFPGQLLHEIYHEFGPRILELNVRSFLQARGKVNRGIRDTLKNEPGRFIAYNNGISATAEEVELVDSDGGQAIARLRGLQIVNGGQTVASIHRAKQRDRQDLSQVSVQAKVTVVKPELIDSLVPQISRYANTQNRVNEADFSANHPFHVQLQQMSQTVWAPGQQKRWFYERARGQYEVAKQREGTTPARLRRFTDANPARLRFDKVGLAKFVNAWDQLPHMVSRGGQKNFLAFMQRLQGAHPSSWEPDAAYFRETIAKAIVFKHAEHVARMHAFPGYRANAVAYTVSLVSYRTAGRVDLKTIWERQTVSTALNDTIREWMPLVFDALIRSSEGRNVTEWCKKEECWRRMQTLDVNISEQLREELSRGQPLPTVGADRDRGSDVLSEEDRENIARVMQVPAESWVRISGWGSRTGQMQDWQCGIAATLASYAAAGWNRVPSKKQALHGAKIVRLAEDAGALSEDDDSPQVD